MEAGSDYCIKMQWRQRLPGAVELSLLSEGLLCATLSWRRFKLWQLSELSLLTSLFEASVQLGGRRSLSWEPGGP